MSDRIVGGIDVGGTKIAGALVDTWTGERSEHVVMQTPVELGGAGVLTACAEIAARWHGVRSVGIAICEIVDSSGRTRSAATIDWRELDVAAPFGGCRVVVESDVRAAALAETRLGAGVGFDPVLYVSVGTGVSHCLVVGGTPFRGAHGAALVTGAPPVEEIASGLALQRRSGRARAESVLSDPVLAPLVDEAVATLGLAVATLVNALDPAIVVIGGGLGLEPAFRSRVTETAHRAVYPVVGRAIELVPAALGADAPIVGAALAAGRGD